jgi:type II secretory pathway component PulL
VWIAVAILAALFVVGAAVAAYQINHLHQQVDGLQYNLTLLYKSVLNAATKK